MTIFSIYISVQDRCFVNASRSCSFFAQRCWPRGNKRNEWRNIFD